MALSLLEAAKLHEMNGQDRQSGIVEAFAAGSPLAAILPTVTVSGNAHSWTEEGVLPTASFRSVNEEYTANEGKVTTRVEPLKIVGGLITLDRVVLRTMGNEVRAVHEAMKAKAIGQKVHYALLHGDTSTDSKTIDGLATRFAIGGSRAVANGTAALSMKKLDEALGETEGGGTHILLTRAMQRNITAYMRASGTAIQMTQDAFGRQVPSYDGRPFVIMDPVGIDSTYSILPFTESSSTCSMFVVNASVAGLHVVQDADIAIEDAGKSDSGTLSSTLLEWLIGIADKGPRCVTRLTGITNATATA